MRAVITSVNYADFLEVTLPAWKRFLPKRSLSVATSPDDTATVDVCRHYGVPYTVTDAWERAGDSHVGGEVKFNLALGLDVCLGLAETLVHPPDEGELVGHVSADCYPFGAWPAESSFNDRAVYGFWRYDCKTPRLLEEHLTGVLPLSAYERLPNTHQWPQGYCQFFRWYPGRVFRSYASARKFDTEFSARFTQHTMLTDVYLLHLGIMDKANWEGRTVPVWA